MIATDVAQIDANIFLLSAATGAQVSKRLYLDDGSFPRHISSYGLLLEDDSRVFYADRISGSTRPNGYEQRMRLGVFDFSAVTYDVYENFQSFGRSAALVRGIGAHS